MSFLLIAILRTSLLSKKFFVKNCTLLGIFAVNNLTVVPEQPVGPMFKVQESKNHYSLCTRNSPEDIGSRLLAGGSFKSQILRCQNPNGLLPLLINHTLIQSEPFRRKILAE
jgi:hypothetical protein